MFILLKSQEIINPNSIFLIVQDKDSLELTFNLIKDKNFPIFQKIKIANEQIINDFIAKVYNIKKIEFYLFTIFILLSRIMQNDVEAPNLDHLTTLIRIIRQRQQLYFSLLSFINKNIQSSSNKLDQIGLFNRFLSQIKNQQKNLKRQEEILYDMFWINKEQPYQNFHMRKNFKQISRLTLRLIEMLQSSLQRSTNTIFNNSGRLSLQFFRFKKLLHRITSTDLINIKTFVTTLLNYAINKFNRQIFKIQKYMLKLESGQCINLRDMYVKDGSDVSCQEQQSKQVKLQKKENNDAKKQLLQRPGKSLKKRQPNRSSLIKQKTTKKQTLKEQKSEQNTCLNQRSKTATKLYKFMNFLQLNKKDFMQDYIFEEKQKQIQKQRILTSLLQRNKPIKQQIKTYVDKSQHYLKTIAECSNINLNLNKCTTDQQDNKNTMPRNQSFNGQKLSLRKSFVISKRKSSFNLENPSSSGNSDTEVGSTFFSKGIKNLTQGKFSQSLPKSHNKANRMYIVKAPMLFEEEIIPQAPVSNQVRKDYSSMMKGKQKKNENVRMRRRNNPTPLEKSSFLQTFRYQVQPK